MFYTRVWSILRMFYKWDFTHKEISVTSKMLYFKVTPVSLFLHLLSMISGISCWNVDIQFMDQSHLTLIQSISNKDSIYIPTIKIKILNGNLNLPHLFDFPASGRPPLHQVEHFPRTFFKNLQKKSLANGEHFSKI